MPGLNPFDFISFSRDRIFCRILTEYADALAHHPPPPEPHPMMKAPATHKAPVKSTEGRCSFRPVDTTTVK